MLYDAQVPGGGSRLTHGRTSVTFMCSMNTLCSDQWVSAVILTQRQLPRVAHNCARVVVSPALKWKPLQTREGAVAVQ